MSQSEQEYWTEQLTAARHAQLETVRKAATSWSTLFAAILGIFGTVTFAGGLTTLDKLNPEVQPIIRLSALAAILLTLAATILSGLVTTSSPRTTNIVTWDGLRDTTKKRALNALRLLRAAMTCGVLAASVVVLASTYVLYAGGQKAPSTAPSVIAVRNGVAVCGQLALRGGELVVKDTPLTEVTSITVVAECP